MSSIPVINTVDSCVTAVAALINNTPNVVLTIGLRNGLAPISVVGLEIVTQVPGPVSAGILGLWRVEGSR